MALESLGVRPDQSVFVAMEDPTNSGVQGKWGFTTVMTTEIAGAIWPEKIASRAVHADYTNSSLRELTRA